MRENGQEFVCHSGTIVLGREECLWCSSCLRAHTVILEDSWQHPVPCGVEERHLWQKPAPGKKCTQQCCISLSDDIHIQSMIELQTCTVLSIAAASLATQNGDFLSRPQIVQLHCKNCWRQSQPGGSNMHFQQFAIDHPSEHSQTMVSTSGVLVLCMVEHLENIVTIAGQHLVMTHFKVHRHQQIQPKFSHSTDKNTSH